MQVLLEAQPGQVLPRRGFDVDGDPARQAAGRLDAVVPRPGQDFEVDVALEPVAEPQHFHHRHHGLHGAGNVRADAGAEEQALHQPLAPQLHEEPRQLLRPERAAGDVPAYLDHAVGAIVDADVGQEHLEQRYGAAAGQRRMVDLAELRPGRGPAR